MNSGWHLKQKRFRVFDRNESLHCDTSIQTHQTGWHSDEEVTSHQHILDVLIPHNKLDCSFWENKATEMSTFDLIGTSLLAQIVSQTYGWIRVKCIQADKIKKLTEASALQRLQQFQVFFVVKMGKCLSHCLFRLVTQKCLNQWRQHTNQEK